MEIILLNQHRLHVPETASTEEPLNYQEATSIKHISEDQKLLQQLEKMGKSMHGIEEHIVQFVQDYALNGMYNVD